ncbi:MAG TPA: aminotransferase class IV [Saprospiraceae bacterium]|nr:aminotransferase class IV [Saprospiraceae bacterium]HMP23533.1 aminotransferase class IV [Saprospiraceae bacterium]
MIAYYNVNGTLTPAAEAALKVTDLAILRGYGVFDFFLVRSGVPMYVEDYVARFQRSARLLYLELPMPTDQLIGQIHSLIEANGLPDASIRLVLTGGYAEDGYTPVQPNLLILAHPMPTYATSVMTEGVKVLLYAFQREVPEAKTINYLTGIREAARMRAEGAVEILYHDGRYVREGVRSNFFILTQDGILVTPQEKILHGITRKNTIELARQHFQVEERDVTPAELFAAQEVFLTSTTKGAMPVVQVDGQTIGNGQPGPITLQLAELLRQRDAAYVQAAHKVLPIESTAI